MSIVAAAGGEQQEQESRQQQAAEPGRVVCDHGGILAEMAGEAETCAAMLAFLLRCVSCSGDAAVYG